MFHVEHDSKLALLSLSLLESLQMGNAVAIVNQKGGVGKTTTTINLAASLSLAGKEILIIDTDPQGNSTTGLGIDRDKIEKNLYDVYAENCIPEEAIVPTGIEHLSLIPSTIDLLGVEVELVGKERREYLLSKIISRIKDKYQYILLDCPPSLGLLSLNALVAADSVIIPVQCEYYALEGLGLITRTIQLVRNSFNPALELKGVLLTMFDTRNSLSHQVVKEVQKHFGDKVFKTMIPRNVTLSEAPSHGKAAIFYDIRSSGAQSYLSLAKEILNENGIRKRA